MLKKAKIIISSVLGSLTLFVGTKVMAVTPIEPPIQVGSRNLSDTITIIVNSVLGIAAFIAVVYIIIGGFNYITSSGNAEKVQGATKTITYAVIGLVVIGLAFAIERYALNLLGFTSVTPGI